MIIRPAIITIEVLIALIIMFSAVVLTTSSLRTMNLFKLKKEKYEINYSTVLSLKALFENRRFNPLGGEFSGEINGLKYEMKYTLSENKKTYVVGETVLHKKILDFPSLKKLYAPPHLQKNLVFYNFVLYHK